MSSVHVQSKIEIESLLEGIAQLDISELAKFQEQVTHLLAQRKAPHLSRQESEYLLKINEGFSAEFYTQYNALQEKLQEETLSPEEHQTLLQLNDKLEAKNVERMQYLIELAQLRSVSLDDLMQQLGLQHG